MLDTAARMTFYPISEDQVAEIAQTISAMFKPCHLSAHLTNEVAYRLFHIYCVENQRFPSSVLVVNKIIDKVLSLANKTIDLHTCTVGELRRKIKDLPDSMPVMIERAPDGRSAAHVVRMDYETIKIDQDYLESCKKNGAPENTRLIEKNGQHLLQSTLPFDHAFSASVFKNAEDLSAFCIYTSY